jgi:hypothetical protein
MSTTAAKKATKRSRPQLNLQPIKKWKEAAEQNVISADELDELMKGDVAPLVVDVRSVAEREDGFIRDSAHCPYSDPE